ncbi:MAG: DUF1003 domain-containing protein [bacterium]
MKTENSFECPICNISKPLREGRPEQFVSGPVGELIRKKHPDWGPGHIICQTCLKDFREEYLKEAIKQQAGEITAVENEVINSLREHEVLVKNIGLQFEESKSLGQRMADKVATFGGSWKFISLFGSVLVIWIIINSYVLLSRPFDPYPFILLNLLLSCLAAIQAPIIMMSQNRQEAKDRLRSEHDYQINLKAEIEIRQLHAKLDQLINHSWQRLLDIQRLQVDLIEELASKK